MGERTIKFCDVDNVELTGNLPGFQKVWIDDGIFHSAKFDTQVFFDKEPSSKAETCSTECSVELYRRYLSHGTLDKDPLPLPTEEHKI